MSAIRVTYRFPHGADGAKLAQKLALGQSAGTWDAAWEHRAQRFRAHLAEVESTGLGADGAPVAIIRFPQANTESDIATLLTMIFGKYSLGPAAKVMAVELPQGYGTPAKFGITGIRNRLGVHGRPLVMAIFKPALGLSAEDHGTIFRQVAEAGVDLVIDDEIMADLPSAATQARLGAVRPVIDAVAQKTGKAPLYALNLTGRADQLLDKARTLVTQGANAFLLNIFSYGFPILEALARDAEVNVPIFLHPALAGAMGAAPDHGLSYPVLLGALPAHSGADAMLYPAHYGNMPMTAVDEAEIRRHLVARNVFPVPSAGIHPGVVPLVLRDYGNDCILNAGTAIMDHPAGPAAGVAAFFEALEQAQPGVPFTMAALRGDALRQAVEKWGAAA